MFYTFYEDTFNVVCICEIENRRCDLIHIVYCEHFHAKSVWKAMVFDIVRWRDLNYYSLNEKYLKILLQRKLILNIDIRIII